MIDLSTLKPGDTVKFRCGGEAVVDWVHFKPSAVLKLYKFKESTESTHYYDDGTVHSIGEIFDIVEIIPAPFNWDTVENGMAFIFDKDELVHYVGELPDKDSLLNTHVLQDQRGRIHKYDPEDLTRAPEKDIYP